MLLGSDIFARHTVRIHGYIKRLLVIVGSLSVLWVAARGVTVSLNREVHDLFARSEFLGHFEEEKLKSLRWAEPTGIRGVGVTQEDVVDLLRFLKEKNENFFIYRDFTIFYALANAPSPQPVLWFHKGLTYPKFDNTHIDRWIVSDLKKNGVQIIIIEEKTLIGTENSLDDFPRLESHIERAFRKTGQIGIFQIFEIKRE